MVISLVKVFLQDLLTIKSAYGIISLTLNEQIFLTKYEVFYILLVKSVFV